jgi:hypothetical protein
MKSQSNMSVVSVSKQATQLDNKSRQQAESVASEDHAAHQSSKDPKIDGDRLALTFASEINVIVIPRIDDSMKTTLFYQESEINLWRCELKMRKAGMDPDNFDWRSMR